MDRNMKRLLLSLVVICSLSPVMAQNERLGAPIPMQNYDSLKSAGAVGNNSFFLQTNSPQSFQSGTPVAVQSTPLNCMGLIPIDSTFLVVPFVGGQAPDYRNDDASSPAIPLPFTFCFYGQNWNSVYINNNGNISFGAPYGTFSASGFPSNMFVMIAGFWGDVDTRAAASGVVYYQMTPTHLVIRWNNVGYYSQHTNLLNDFQVVITDGTDPILPPGTNVALSYGDMQWTTGDASGGVNGFGGTAATVGCNLGDGINYIQLGTFDQPGTLYNGPFGPPSQVSWLDNQQFFLDACTPGGGGNVPPIMTCTMVCDTINLCLGDTLPLVAQWLSPENNQLTSSSATASGTGLVNVGTPPANIINLNAYFVGLPTNLGYNTIIVSGTDNGVPAQTTSGIIVVNVIPGPTAVVTSTGACPGDSVMFGSSSTQLIPGNGPITSYHWDFGMTALTNDTANTDTTGYAYANPGTYTVILEVTDSLGCSDTAQYQAVVYELPVAAFTGAPLQGCAPLCVDFTDQSTVTNSTIAQWSWSFDNGVYSTLQNDSTCYLDQGTYSIELVVTSAQGCKDSITMTNYVTVIPGPIAGFTFGPQPATISDATITFVDMSTNGTVEWAWSFGDNGTSNDPNPIWIYGDTGTFTVMQIVSGPGGACPDTAWAEVFISPELLIWIPNGFTPNGNGNNDVFGPVFSDISYITKFEMTIWDRWGNLVYKTTDPYQTWDGKLNGDPCEVDTYVYKIYIEDINFKFYRYMGGVNLIR